MLSSSPRPGSRLRSCEGFWPAVWTRQRGALRRASRRRIPRPAHAAAAVVDRRPRRARLCHCSGLPNRPAGARMDFSDAERARLRRAVIPGPQPVHRLRTRRGPQGPDERPSRPRCSVGYEPDLRRRPPHAPPASDGAQRRCRPGGPATRHRRGYAQAHGPGRLVRVQRGPGSAGYRGPSSSAAAGRPSRAT